MKKPTENFLRYRYEYWKRTIFYLILACSIGSAVWVLKDIFLSHGSSFLKSLLCRGLPSLFIFVYLKFKNYKNFLFLACSHIWMSIAGVIVLYCLDDSLANSGGGWMMYVSMIFVACIASGIVSILLNTFSLYDILYVVYRIFPEKLTIPFTEFIFSSVALMTSFIVICYHIHVLFKRNYESRQKLYDMSYTDQLTGAYNRRVIDTLTDSQKLKENCILFIIDVDNFKKLNDSYGHSVGDGCLIKVVNALNASFDNPDDGVVIRYGGDEFLVLYNTDLYTKDHYSKLINALNTDNKYNVTLSIGSTKADVGENIYDCIKRADVALYAVKQAGRNGIRIFEDMDFFEN